MIHISQAYWNTVYLSYLACRKQHNMEVSILLLNNSDACFVRLLHNSIHTRLDIIKHAYREKPDIKYNFTACNQHKESKNHLLFIFLQQAYYTTLGKLLDLQCLSILIYKMGIIAPALQCYVVNYLMCAKSFTYNMLHLVIVLNHT